MRKLIVSLVAGAAGALLVSSAAQATPTFTVQETGTGLTSVSITVSQTATFDVFLSYTPGDGLAGYATSITWDGGPTPFLDGVTGASILPAGFTFLVPAAVGYTQSAGGTPGVASSYGATSFTPPVSGTFLIGTITVHGAAVGTTSLTPVLIGGDGTSTALGTFICSSGAPGTCTFNGATVNVVPEPATAGLLGLGLLGLAVAGQRVRRR